MTFLQVFQLLTLFTAVGLAFFRGGRPERLAAIILVALLLIDRAWHLIFGWSDFAAIDLWHLTLDITALIAAVCLALVADRFWTLCFAAFQLISTLGHGLRVVRADMPEAVYAAMIIGPSHLMIATLIVGTISFHRRKVPWREPIS